MWNTTTLTWSELGSGINGTVNCMSVINSNLYVGGTFTSAGGISVSNIAMWNGSWNAIGSGTNGTIYSMTNYGNTLYIGGNFSLAGGITVSSFALLNDTSWSTLSVLNNSIINNNINAICCNINVIYLGGLFTNFIYSIN